MSSFFWGWALSCALLAAAAVAQATPSAGVLTLESGKHVYPVRSARVITDADNTLTIEELLRLESAGKAPWTQAQKLNFGYSRARYWLKLEIDGSHADEQDWVMEFGYPLIQVLDVYKSGGVGRPEAWHTGKLAPFDSRPIAHRNYIFSFSARKGGLTTFYLMLESSGTLLAPITVYSQKEYLSRSSGASAAIGVYCGVIMAMVLFNFFLLVTSRDRNYVYYIGYALSFCLLMNTLNGMTYQFLWPKAPAWNNVSVPVLAGVCYLFLALFTRSILDTRRYAPRVAAGLYLIVAGALYLLFGGLFFYGLHVNKFTSFFISSAPLVVLPISLWCLYKGAPAAGYYSLAFAFFFLGAAIRAARDLAWIPQNVFADYGPYLGSAVEMLLLSLALAVRIRQLKEEKLKSELHSVKVERDLSVSRSELEKQSAIASFSAQVAHDIRSPLAALGSAARDPGIPQEQRQLMEAAVSRMQSIADDLLQRYRAPGAAQKAAVEPCDLTGLIEQVLAEKRLQHKDKAGVSIEFNDTAVGIKVAVDAKELQRIVSNLVNNSVEALTGPGSVTVNLASEGDKVIMVIRDNGKGIAPEILAKLGQKGETHGKTGGTGLGLYHARTAVESWGGSLHMDSKLGEGTAVTITLPAAPDAVPEAKAASGLVVLVDDDALVRMNWKAAARAKGLELRVYASAAELEAAGDIPLDAAIYIDSELGAGVKGEDLAARLKERGYSDLTLETGHPAANFAHLPWLKVAGKEPPLALTR